MTTKRISGENICVIDKCGVVQGTLNDGIYPRLNGSKIVCGWGIIVGFPVFIHDIMESQNYYCIYWETKRWSQLI